jgi:hypothetical protein
MNQHMQNDFNPYLKNSQNISNLHSFKKYQKTNYKLIKIHSKDKACFIAPLFPKKSTKMRKLVGFLTRNNLKFMMSNLDFKE